MITIPEPIQVQKRFATKRITIAMTMWTKGLRRLSTRTPTGMAMEIRPRLHQLVRPRLDTLRIKLIVTTPRAVSIPGRRKSVTRAMWMKTVTGRPTTKTAALPIPGRPPITLTRMTMEMELRRVLGVGIVMIHRVVK